MERVIQQAPQRFGYQRTRWTLDLIARCCSWLGVTTLGAVSNLLKRLGIRYKRGRRSLHSPDARYEPKRYRLDICRFRSKYQPQHSVFLYLDEFTYYRQPTTARAYAPVGHHQALAPLSHQSDTTCRIIAALNAVTGQVTARQYNKITLPRLSDFYALLAQTYPDAKVIYLALDNWPVHFHPDVLARLMPQDAAADFRTPPNWPSLPSARANFDCLPIQLLPLPTYAPWLNPIEKLWLWLYQNHLFLHRSADAWLELKQQVQHFLDQFQFGSFPLLRYVGLLPY